MNEQMQALAFFAGANSIFYGEKLLTTPNPEANRDMALFSRLGIQPEAHQTDIEAESDLQAVVDRAAHDKYFYDAARN